MKRTKIAVVHPGLRFGGSEARVLWTIDTLKTDYEVALITMGEVDLECLNAYYGTTLRPGDFSVLRVPLPRGIRNATKFSAFRGRFLYRYVKRAARDFDVLISCYGPMDFGQRGIQMIADFAFVDEWRFSLHPVLRDWKTWWYGDSLVRKAYLAACSMVSPFRPEGWNGNLTIANSHWTAELLQQGFGVESEVLYPPVDGGFPEVPFEERENGFVCIGRVTPEKQMDRVIAILQRVRERGHDVHLHILGDHWHSPFGAQIRALAEQHREWVFLDGHVAGWEKKKLVAQHRYGINACLSEAFGIAVAEIVRAGSLAFVPNGGGQVEIVNHPNLIYSDDDDAVEKIVAMLADPERREALRAHLAGMAWNFSVQKFQKRMKEIVGTFLEQRRRPKVAVIHPGLGFGGSEATALWTIAALKRDYQVTLVTMEEVDLQRLNTYYGTSLASGDFAIRTAPVPRVLRRSAKFAALRGRYLLRYVQRVAPEFDAMFSCYGPMDFGKPGIQRIVDLSFVEDWRLELEPTFRSWRGWFYGDTWVRHFYLGLCDRIAKVNPPAWKQNVSVANSLWTGDRMVEKYGMRCAVHYGPVEGEYAEVPFAPRENGFVCLGRVSPEKCIESVIEILSRVRKRGHDVHLHILGGVDDSAYGKKIRRLAEQNSAWVYLEGWVVGEQKRRILSAHRYGINRRPNETFGIAVAEMVQAGCITFVPSGGGQVETVKHPQLIFADDGEAVEKIVAVLSDENQRKELRDHLRRQSHNYSVESFMEATRECVAEFMENHRGVETS